MCKIRMILMAVTILSAQQLFADNALDMSGNSSGNKSCATIAHACKTAGYVRAGNSDKRFWQDCMKPVILGKTVSGVTVDPSVVQVCRVNKIEELKKELQELQSSMPKSN